MSQEAAAELIGTNNKTWSRWELNQEIPPRAKARKTVDLIVEVLRCSEEEKEQLIWAYICGRAKEAGFLEGS